MLQDVVMPGRIDGIELAGAVQALYPHLPILLTTGFVPVDTDVAWPVLRKPYGIDLQSDALRKLLDKTPDRTAGFLKVAGMARVRCLHATCADRSWVWL